MGPAKQAHSSSYRDQRPGLPAASAVESGQAAPQALQQASRMESGPPPLPACRSLFEHAEQPAQRVHKRQQAVALLQPALLLGRLAHRCAALRDALRARGCQGIQVHARAGGCGGLYMGRG